MLGPKNFFKSRKAAFYIELACAVLGIVAAIIYASVFNGSRYMSWAVFVLPFIAAVAFAGMCIFPITERWASVAMFGFDFITLLVFIRTVYLYLSEVFYDGKLGGVTTAFVLFVIVTVLFIVNLIATNVCIYLKPSDASRISDDKNQAKKAGEQA